MLNINGFKNKMQSFRYEEGRPVDLPDKARQLSGQDGWENIEGIGIPVVSNVHVWTGNQAVYRGMSGGASRLRRKVNVWKSEELLKVSAYFYYAGETGQDEHANTVSLQLDDMNGVGIMKFGIGCKSGRAELYACISDNTGGMKEYGNPYPLKEEGWYWMEAAIDQGNRQIMSVNATIVFEAFVPASCWEAISIVPAPVSYAAGIADGYVHFIELCMGDDTAVDDITFGEEKINFEAPAYSMEGMQVRKGALHVHEAALPAVKGEAYVYCTFEMLAGNPLPFVNGLQQGLQTIAIGQETEGGFIPAVRFGMTDGRNLGRGYLTTWVFDGKLDYYGDYVRPETQYDFKLKLDMDNCRISVWYRGRGEDNWFMVLEEAQLINPVKEINMVKVEQYPGAPGISGFAAGTELWGEGEAMRGHPLAKPDRNVTEGAGYRFQQMRSVWRKPGKHVIIARNPDRWMGFPTVVQTGPDKLACAYNDGRGHGGGGGAFIRHSNDCGRTWSEELMVHPEGVNSPRLQKLKDGTLLLLADVYDSKFSVVFYDSYDGGNTWGNQRWLDPIEAGGNASSVPSSVAELDDGSWLLAASHYPGGSPWAGTEGEQLEFYRSPDRGKTWKLHSILKPPFPYSIGEPTILTLPDGKLLMYIRDNGSSFPGHKAYSNDNGKTWKLEGLPFLVNGRTCAGFLKDGRVMLTTRSPYPGRAFLGAWIGYPYDKTEFSIAGTHFNDARSAGIKDGLLHIDSDGRCGQFTQYTVRYPDSPESIIDITARVKVVSNSGHAATICVPYAGKLRLFPDRAEFAVDDQSFTIRVQQGEFHTYRVVSGNGRAKVFVDGLVELDTDEVNNHVIRIPWTPSGLSHYPFSFGNEDVRPSMAFMSYPDQYMHKDVTGYSIWSSVETITDDPKTGRRTILWKAADGFPDQYQLDHIIEVDASVCGWDEGYSGWVELDDGQIFVVNYTDDMAPSLNGIFGVPYIRGTFLEPSDLPH